ncbi:MAG: hypothetical protein QM793_14640 [Muricomes sp.]
MNAPKSPSSLNRRDSLKHLGLFGSGLVLWACGGTSGTNADGLGGGGASTGGVGSSSGGTSATGGANAGGATGSATEWASGGTVSMTGDYANPFSSPVSSCAVFDSTTEGPCTEAADQVRVNISEGYSGLPMRIALLIVDASCAPIVGAKVKIWHTQRTGSYSGDTPNNGMCLKDQADSSKHYFRGAQTTNEEGRVNFDSCFPGWYSGRAIHIHFTVSLDGKAFTSQLFFAQDLIDEIFTSHPDYSNFGTPDTPNSTDNIIGGKTLDPFLFDTKRLDDGALLAAKVITVAL